MPSDQKKMTLKEAILNKRMLNCIFNGFTAGLPIYFIIQFSEEYKTRSFLACDHCLM